MRHRGVDYTIRIGIKRGEWRVVVTDEHATIERTVNGTRQQAEEAAKRAIDSLLWRSSRAVG